MPDHDFHAWISRPPLWRIVGNERAVPPVGTAVGKIEAPTGRKGVARSIPEHALPSAVTHALKSTQHLPDHANPAAR
jgi:hypothetical protein